MSTRIRYWTFDFYPLKFDCIRWFALLNHDQTIAKKLLKSSFQLFSDFRNSFLSANDDYEYKKKQKKNE